MRELKPLISTVMMMIFALFSISMIANMGRSIIGGLGGNHTSETPPSSAILSTCTLPSSFAPNYNIYSSTICP